jgi:VTC domain
MIKSTTEAVSPLILERYELKYLIPLDLVEPISQYAEMYCEMDYYSQIEPEHFYVINSLYFDSDDFKIFNYKQLSQSNRFNLRIRSYGSNPKPPYFFEVKKKSNDVVRKIRGKVFEPDLNLFIDQILEGEIEADPKSQAAVNEFLYWNYRFQAQPKVLTQYRRKAYISTVDDYARVTFDRDLRYHHETNWNVIPNEQYLQHYDHALAFKDTQSFVILELKSTTKVPMWMIDMIKYFNLYRQSISKFENAMLSDYSHLGMFPEERIFHLHT